MVEAILMICEITGGATRLKARSKPSWTPSIVRKIALVIQVQARALAIALVLLLLPLPPPEEVSGIK